MSFSPTDSPLFGSLFSHPEMAKIFAAEQFIANMVQVEVALATVQGRLGVILATAVSPITIAAQTFQPDMAQMRIGLEKAGIPVIELVRQLKQSVGGEAAHYIHYGATSQDIMDTAFILQIRAALALLRDSLQETISNLAQLADRHRHTLMAGRTHSQQALPLTFGLKVANWLAPLLRHQQRLSQLQPRLLIVQFGGAAGTLASLGDEGLAVRQALAAELGLGVPPIPWHTQRDNLAELAAWLSLVTGSLAKMAQDIILLAQTEIGELRETADPTRGGSSTMPQKSNPILSEGIIAAARANANLLATMHQALIQEQERATHGWQLEWLTLPQMFAHTATCLYKANFLSQNLAVNTERMKQNVAATKGLMLAEALTFALAQHMPHPEAKQLVTAACQRTLSENRHLVDVVQQETLRQAQGKLPLDWQSLRNEANYLGTTQTLIDNILENVKRKT